jgi:hypothetical protein
MNTASRKETIELLPWFENGTLDGAEHDAVRALLACDLDANRQVREIRALRTAIADEPILATNMQMNLRRLYARMDPPARRRPVWFMPLSYAAAALLTVSAGMGIFFAGERAGSYVTLTNPSSLAAPADSVIYRVDVVAGVDAGELAALTGVAGVRVLEGPSERGVATLAVPGADAERVLAKLHADPRLRFVTAVPR